MAEIAKKTLEKIKEEKITPEPKWKFFLTDWAYWGFFAFTIVFGSLSFSVIFFVLRESDWDIYRYLHHGPWSFTLELLPYFWIASLSFFLFLAIINFHHTKHGYRFTPTLIVGSSILLSALLGASLSLIKAGEVLDDALFENYPTYGKIAGFHRTVWNDPENGLLNGLVISKEDGTVKIIDRNKKVWEVNCSSLCEETDIVKIGVPARFIGEQTGSNSFSAEEIRHGKIGAPPLPLKIIRPKLKMLIN